MNTNHCSAVFPADLVAPDIDWGLVYEKLGLSRRFAEIPQSPENSDFWTIPVLYGVNCGLVVRAITDHCDIGFDDNLMPGHLDLPDKRNNGRGYYFVGYKRQINATAGPIHETANCMVPIEWLLLQFGLLATDDKNFRLLDTSCATKFPDFCPPDGSVISAGWSGILCTIIFDKCWPEESYFSELGHREAAYLR